MAAQSRAVTVVVWVLQILVAAMFVLTGGSKLAGAAAMVQMYDTIGWGQWFRYVTGVIEVGSAFLLLLPSTAIFGALLLVCTMIGAIIAHFTVLHSPPTGPVILLSLSGAIVWLRRSQLTPAPG
jgi:putative oxidoreductase